MRSSAVPAFRLLAVLKAHCVADVVYELAVRHSIEHGMNDLGAGRLGDTSDMRREDGLE